MYYQKPESRFDDGRKLLISFVPEEDMGIANPTTTQSWANRLAKHLNAKKKNFSTVVYNQAGTHKDANTRVSGTYTDFLVVYTVDYASSPPPELAKVVDEIKHLDEQSKMLMWLAQYDADSYRDSGLSELFQFWHVLTGKGKNGTRFRKPGEDPAWEDDLTDAASHIHNHPSCDQKSPVCPKHQSSTTANNQNNTAQSPSFIKRIFGWRRSN